MNAAGVIVDFGAGALAVTLGALAFAAYLAVMARRAERRSLERPCWRDHGAVTTRRRTAEPPTRPDPELAPPAPTIVPWKALAWPCTHVGPGTTDLVRDSLGRAYIVCGECGSTMRFPEADNLQDAPTPQDAR